MSVISRASIERVLGPTDDHAAAEIARTGASEADLQEAQAWLCSDDALVNDLHPLPKGRVGTLIELLQALDGQPERDE